MRYAPRAILAGGLGFAVSCVAACGGGAGLLSGDESIALSGQGNEITSAVQSGNCGAAINASVALNRAVLDAAGHDQPHAPQQPEPGRADDRAARVEGLPSTHGDDHVDPGDDILLDQHAVDIVHHLANHVEQHDDHLDFDLDDVDIRNHAAQHGYFYYEHHERWRGTQRGDHHRDWIWQQRRNRRGQCEQWRKRRWWVTNGTAIVGRYRIEGRLGVGGMSTVQLAFDQRLERYVAIKLLAEHLADDPTFVSRFRREALSAARLVHPNIVQVFDFGFDEEAHQHFIVMEHVPGHSCAELLRDHGPMQVAQAVDVVTQACRGLDYAHRNGVVHRDVKPGNLLVSDSDVVKLADFGIARATDQSSITQVGSVLGTAAYLAPEQARGEEAGPRADLYSLGVVAYQLMTGRLPYEANSLSELALKQQREPPASADELNPQVPPELADAISLALALDQEERPETALLFGEAITEWRPRCRAEPERSADPKPRGHRRHPGAVGAGPADGPDPRAAPPTSRTTAPRPRQLEPRRPAYPPPMSGYGPDEARRAPARRSGGSRAARRFFAFLAIVVLFVAAVAVAVTIATSTSNNVVHYRKVVAHDTSDAVKQLQQIISQYTK